MISEPVGLDAAPGLSSVPTRRGLKESAVGVMSALSNLGTGVRDTYVYHAGSSILGAYVEGSGFCSSLRSDFDVEAHGYGSEKDESAAPPGSGDGTRLHRTGDRRVPAAGGRGEAGIAVVGLGVDGGAVLRHCRAAYVAAQAIGAFGVASDDPGRGSEGGVGLTLRRPGAGRGPVVPGVPATAGPRLLPGRRRTAWQRGGGGVA